MLPAGARPAHPIRPARVKNGSKQKSSYFEGTAAPRLPQLCYFSLKSFTMEARRHGLELDHEGIERFESLRTIEGVLVSLMTGRFNDSMPFSVSPCLRASVVKSHSCLWNVRISRKW